MNNLYRRLTNKGYTTHKIDELLWRMSHRLSISYVDQEELVEYFNDYVSWNMQQEQTKKDIQQYDEYWYK